MKEIYLDSTYLKQNPTWHEEDAEWKFKQIDKMICENALDLHTICEVGCGSGEILKQCSEKYPDKIFYGYDISPQVFEICEKKTKGNLIFKQQDFLKETNKYFDAIMLIDVFEHIEDYFSFLRDIKNKSKYKIFHIPLDLSIQNLWSGFTSCACQVNIN